MVRLLLVEGDASIAAELCERLAGAGMSVVATVDSVEAAVAEAKRMKPDVILIDTRQGSGLSEIDTAVEIRREIDLPIVYLTARFSPSSAGWRERASYGYVMKTFQESELIAAIDMVVQRRAREGGVAPARESPGQAARTLSATRERYATLTPREREVFALVVRGKLNKQIAGDLGIAERTVKAHRARVMRKMGVESLADLARLAERLGI